MRKLLAVSTLLLALVILLATGCGGPQPTEPVAPAATAPPPTATTEPATPAPATATPAPTATPTEARNLEKVTLEFRTTVPSIEDADRVLEILLDEPGVTDGLATEASLSITYDPELITLDEIRNRIESQGFLLKGSPEERASEKVDFAFLEPLASIVDAQQLTTALREIPGITDAIGDENSLTVTYDPEVISVEEIREAVEGEGVSIAD